MEKGCKFCSDYTFLKSFCKAKQPDNKLHDRWMVGLFHEVKNGHDLRSRTGYGDFHLNYCPECGKKLSGRSKNNNGNVQ